MKTHGVFSLSKGLALAALIAPLPAGLRADTNLTVAADGSAQFRSVQAAIMSVPAGTASNQVFIRIKPGTYRENIYLQREKRYFHLIGEDPETTILTYHLHANMPGPDGKPIGTFRTPSTLIDADNFTAENITFENSAGPVGQALATRLGRPFVELNREVEEEAGLSLQEIITLYGQSGYRNLERRCLEQVVVKHPQVVLATGGGIVADYAGSGSGGRVRLHGNEVRGSSE